jgi:anaerobic magnesium-protoporphyrin IX monomethyl ester cyclase
MVILDEKELVTLPSPASELTGFRDLESSGGNLWRWATKNSQSISFATKSKRNRIHYRITVPVAGTKLLIRHGEKCCLTLSSTLEKNTFHGFFEFFAQEEDKLILHFSVEREHSDALHLADPTLSFMIQRFTLVEIDGCEEPPRELPAKILRTTVITIPTWITFVPPMGTAYLASTLRSAGFPATVIDFNIIAWHKLKEIRIEGEDLWSSGNAKYFRDKNLFTSFLLPKLQETLDELVENICLSNPDVIGFTLFYTSFPCAHYIANACKKRLPHVRIICGGPEIGAAYTDYVLEEMQLSPIEVCVIGEGEATLLELLRRWGNGLKLDGCKGIVHKRESGLAVVEPLRQQLPYSSIPFPDYSDFDLSQYTDSNALPVMMSRGCVARCAFCSETRFWLKYRFDDAERTFQQISLLIKKFKIHKFYFNDSLINGNFEMLSKLADLIIESGLKFNWVGQARVDQRMTSELLVRLAASGCTFLSYGFESGSQKVVDLMDKRAKVETAKTVLRATHDAGIVAGLNILVGFPGEEESDFEQTMNFVQNNLPYISEVALNEMNIFIGIPVGDDPKRFGVSIEIPHLGPEWETADGHNTPAIRQARLRRIAGLVESSGIHRGQGSSSR